MQSILNQRDIRLQTRPAVLIAFGLLVVQMGIIVFTKDEATRLLLVDLVFPLVGLLSAVALFYTAWKMLIVSRRFAKAWLFLALGILGWALGDVIWTVLEIFLKVEPFPSIADVFYLAYYPLVIAGFLLMPFERPRRIERLRRALDIGVVILAAGLIYWNFLISPQIVEDSDRLSLLIALAYPIFDLVLFAALLMLLYRRQTLLSPMSLVLLASSILVQLVADTAYTLQSLAGTYVSGEWLDICWQIGFLSFGLAGIYQVEMNSSGTPGKTDPEHPAILGRLNSWLMFLPYVWLVVAYFFLVWADYHPVTMGYHSIAVVVGLMLGMVVTRQALSINEITRLSEKLQIELVERKRAEELLRKSHEELEYRVHQRTEALSTANQQLEIEVEERRITEEQLQVSLNEKEVLLKEIHHRVKNNLQVITSMLKLQSSQVDDPAVQIALQDSQNRVQSMALIHEKLYQSADLGVIDFAGYLESLANFLLRSYNPGEKQVCLRVEVQPVGLGIDAAVPCGLIVNELVSNALKHAFPNGNGGEVTIQLSSQENGQVELSIADNGVGLPENVDLENTPSLGLQLVNALVGQLEGSLELRRDQGTQYTLRFAAVN